MSVLKTFTSMSAFADHLLLRQALVTVELRHCLDVVAEAIQETAQDELGHYQAAIGPFDAWQELAESTKEDRVQQGYTENDPLLRSGELRGSIERELSGLEAVIGSDRDEAVWMELGTTKAPPRPFLGPAIYHNEDLIKEALGAALVTGILGKGVISSTTLTSRRISR